ncbi:hypothetical protein DID99_33265 [Burkholderia sp. Bp8986]|nr:hypothetical protein DID99_33265 [Burkholderia sp. Bp8986]
MRIGFRAVDLHAVAPFDDVVVFCRVIAESWRTRCGMSVIGQLESFASFRQMAEPEGTTAIHFNATH